MLSDDLARYVALHQALGFKFRTQQLLLRMFVSYAERHGDNLIKSNRVIAWAAEAPSPEQRRNRLLTVRRFAIAMHAEDPDHEAPAAEALGRGLFRRTQPYIYSVEEIARLMAAAASLGPTGTLRPLTYSTLFGLLTATGMRICTTAQISLQIGQKANFTPIPDASHRHPVDPGRAPPFVGSDTMPGMAEHSEVGQPTPHVAPLVVGISLTPLIEFALNAEYPDFVCPMIHVHRSLLRLCNPIVFLLPFAPYAAFPHSDYYESSALGVVHIWPSRVEMP